MSGDGAPWSPDPDLNPVVGERRALNALEERNREIDDLKASVRTLKEALIAFGDHRASCAIMVQGGDNCTCGYFDALKG